LVAPGLQLLVRNSRPDTARARVLRSRVNAYGAAMRRSGPRPAGAIRPPPQTLEQPDPFTSAFPSCRWGSPRPCRSVTFSKGSPST